jgi:hypothetical protein
MAGTPVDIGEILFVKIEEEETDAAQVRAASPAVGGKPAKGGGKKEAGPPAPTDPWEAADIRVGKITKVRLISWLFC